LSPIEPRKNTSRRQVKSKPYSNCRHPLPQMVLPSNSRSGRIQELKKMLEGPSRGRGTTSVKSRAVRRLDQEFDGARR
jgi:hypothetical protein